MMVKLPRFPLSDHGGGKPRHYYTRTGGSRRHLVVAGASPAMLASTVRERIQHEGSGYGVVTVPLALT